MRFVDVSEANVAGFSLQARKGRWVVCHYMNGCMHCEMMKPSWQKAKELVKGVDGLNVAEVEYRFTGRLPAGMGKVLAFPSIVQYDDGVAAREFQGMRTAENLAQFLQESAAAPARRRRPASGRKPAAAAKRAAAPKKKKAT